MALWSRRPETSPSPVVRAPVLAPQESNVHQFQAWTESLLITGRTRSDDRLSDALNRRERLRVELPVVTPIGGGPLSRHHALEMAVDPFDLELVLAAPDLRSPHERGARRIHKVRYPVVVDAAPFLIHGVLHVFPGNAPEFVAHLSGALFIPITDARVFRNGSRTGSRGNDVALVNRYGIRRIDQVDGPAN